MGDRSYSKTTEAALFAISVQCYYPECQVPSVSIFGDGENKNVDIAHICAISPSGPRFKSKMTKEDLNSFPNLILLCGLHHRMVDKKENEHRFTEEVLCEWKNENEKEIRDKIAGLSGLTESGLNEMLVTAAESTKNEIQGALGELKDISADAAELLRGLYEKIESHYIDSDSIMLLNAASQRLGHLEEGANMLYSASQRLGFLEEGANLINAASHRLGNIEAGSSAINAASQRLGNLEDTIGALERTAARFSDMDIVAATQRLEQFGSDYAGMLRQSPEIPDVEGAVESAGRSLIAEMDRRLEKIEQMQSPTVIDHEQRWKFGLGGFAAGVLSVLVTVAILAYNGAV